jgi:hypothetical protein
MMSAMFCEFSLEIPELPDIGWIPEKPKVRRSANGTIIDVASAVDIPPVPEALIIDVASAFDIPPVPEALIIDVASAVDIPPVPEVGSRRLGVRFVDGPPEALIIDVVNDVPNIYEYILNGPSSEARGELRSVDCFNLFDIETLSETNSDRSELAGTVTDETALMPQKHATTPFDLDRLGQK